MIALIYLLTTFFFGYYFIKFFVPTKFSDKILLACCAFIIGTFISVWITFLLSLATSFYFAVWAGWEVTVICTITLYFFTQKTKAINSFSKGNLLIFLLLLFISILIMTKTLSEQGGIINIGENIYTDLEMHLPLIRSFSWGNNIPPHSPFFPGGNLAYHFLFDFWTGIIETLGVSIASSFNIASSLSFACFLYILYSFSQHLFAIKSRLLGILTVIFFLFNSSLGFLDSWRKLHPNGILNFLNLLWNNNQYLSVQPFQNDLVSITWNLNVYVNQRHLSYGLAIALILLYIVKNISQEKKEHIKYYIFIGLIAGGLPFWNTPIFISLLITLLVFYFFNWKHLYLLISISIALTLGFLQALFLSSDITPSLSFQPGYITYLPLTITNFSLYWMFNLGLSLFTIPISVIYARTEARKIFVGILTVFVIANLFQFNKELFNNHKFFNYFLVIGNCFTAYLLYRITRFKLGKILFIPLVLLLTFSGITDLAILKNESKIPVADYPNNAFLVWIKENTPPSSVFLTPSDTMYHPIRIAGRKTFQYEPRYAWAYGYNTSITDEVVIRLFMVTKPDEEKSLLKKYNIRYVVIPTYNTAPYIINTNYFSTHLPLVYNDNTQRVYEVIE